MPARAFGQYEVLARLATGGAASIFLARQPGVAGFRKLVCLKTLLPERARDQEFVEMFLDEARLAARLTHPNCVEIYDLGKERGAYYICMEYIFGETLWNLLATVAEVRTPLPPPVVASILASGCEGLHHAHELRNPSGQPYNLVHRDVSPQNIMITFEGQTKVLDFGVAKAETGRQATATGIVKGKFSYMSPEQIAGGAVDRRSDIYSLGIVMFECLASRRLYRAESPEAIARMILERRAPRLKEVVPDIHPELDAICAKALSRSPGSRYATAREMGDALRGFLDTIRFNPSAVPVAKLVEERFGPKIKERRKVYEEALNGTFDEARLLSVLNARPVMEVDLFPDVGNSDDDMPVQARAPLMPPETPGREEPTRGRTPPADPSPRAAVLRVEAGSQASGPIPLSVHEPESLGNTLPPDESATRVDSGSITANESETAHDGDANNTGNQTLPLLGRAETSDATARQLPVVSRTPPMPAVVARADLSETAEEQPPDWRPPVGRPSTALAATAARPRGARLEVVAGVVPKQDGPRPDPGVSVARPRLSPDPASMLPPPPENAPVVQRSMAPPVAAAQPFQPPQVRVAPAPEVRQYSLGVVLAALIFGVTLGLLLGVLLALRL